MMSLSDGGRLENPKNDVSGMTGMITDLTTFYVAITPQIGSRKVTKPNETYYDLQDLKGDFSNGADILIGSDCFNSKIEMTSLSAGEIGYKTTMEAPSESCFVLKTPEMNQPISGVPNNFQMLRRLPNGFILMWGTERLEISSRVDRLSGKIKSAEMQVELVLKQAFCSDQKMTDCHDIEGPHFRLERIVNLESE